MSLPPSISRNYIYSVNNRITFTSLIITMRTFLFGLKQFLKANGYIVVGSSNGVSATPAGLVSLANDSTDRWIAATDAGVRGSSAASPQSWVILRDGNGVDILIAYQGGTDDICRISFSPGQLFTSAATATNQPTASDEQVVTSSNTIISTSLSDRIWHGWVSSDRKSFRVAIAQSLLVIGAWGVENIIPAVQLPILFLIPVIGFAYDRNGLISSGGSFTTNTRSGVGRVSIASLSVNLQLGGGAETSLGQSTLNTSFVQFRPELHGANSFDVFPMSWWTLTSGGRGKLGMRIDWWGYAAEDGTVYNKSSFINIAGNVWPWDRVTGSPMMI
jgi:hypothetical protein